MEPWAALLALGALTAVPAVSAECDYVTLVKCFIEVTPSPLLRATSSMQCYSSLWPLVLIEFCGVLLLS